MRAPARVSQGHAVQQCLGQSRTGDVPMTSLGRLLRGVPGGALSRQFVDVDEDRLGERHQFVDFDARLRPYSTCVPTRSARRSGTRPAPTPGSGQRRALRHRSVCTRAPLRDPGAGSSEPSRSGSRLSAVSTLPPRPHPSDRSSGCGGRNLDRYRATVASIVEGRSIRSASASVGANADQGRSEPTLSPRDK